jgi:hypothetical protein
MPPKKFLDAFLTIPQDAQQYPESMGDYGDVLETSKEVDMYTPFVSMFHIRYIGMLHYSADHGGGGIRSIIEVRRYTRQSGYPA